MKYKNEFAINDHWDVMKFYDIYMENGNKYIRFNYETDREPIDKPYLSWVIIRHSDQCKMLLKDFLMWDVYYQMSLLFDNTHYIKSEVEPQIAFMKANQYIKGNNENGSELMLIKDITENIKCGSYYGY